MKLTIDDTEIKDAITAYVKNQGINTSGKVIDIDLTAGRNGNGHKAEISITAGLSASKELKSNAAVIDISAAASDDVEEDNSEGGSTAESSSLFN